MTRTWVWTPMVLVAVAVLSYAAFIVLRPPGVPEGLLYGNGHIEGTEVSVAAEVSARVLESNLVEGRQLEREALLVRLDDRELRARLAEAQAQAAAVRKARTSLQPELATWQHHLQTAKVDLQRFRDLWQARNVSEQALDQAANREREARGRVAALEAQVQETEARLVAAEQTMRQLELQLAKTVIRAPIGGTVLVKGIEVGELAVPGRVVAILVDLARLELKVYVPERDIGQVKLGALARVRIDAFPDRYFEATVARIDQQAQFTPRDIHMPEERARMVFGVTLAMASPQGYLKPGMPADAWIRVQDDLVWPERLVVPQ